MSNRFYIAVLLILMVNTASGADNHHLHEWAHDHLLHGEHLICARVVNNDYFFAARSGDRIKSGYRIDVTSSSGPPSTFVISWRFQDEHGNHLGLASDPEIVAQGYKILDERMYAEEITYRPVSLVHAKTLHVSIFLKKFDTSATSSNLNKFLEHELDEIAQCDVALTGR
ncbi:hypothetical protein [Thioalkalivibrio sulfidiphilus]|uniref:hypothetical protein n=1 Tax=Thioalkalivibrio sulfidiphilus TaxID=1033854 RepID=UPI003B2E84E2